MISLPFSPQSFFDVFTRYNTTVWPAQIVLSALGVIAFVLALRGGRANGRRVWGTVAFLWLWAGLVYHLTFFRQINPAAAIFAIAFVIEAALVVWLGVLRSDLAFEGRRASRIGGVAIVVYALVAYPLLNVALAHRYPEMPSFGLPCPTTIFTIGLFLLVAPPVPRAVLVVPVLWGIVGSSAALQLGVWEDLGLPVAAIVALMLVLRPQPARGTPAALRGRFS